MTPEQLKARVEYWQQQLRLKDWLIDAQIVSAEELQGMGAWAYNKMDHENRFSQIRLVDPQWAHLLCQNGPPLYPYNLEETLVHEMLHIHLRGWEAEPDTSAFEDHEFAINAIAQALMALESYK